MAISYRRNPGCKASECFYKPSRELADVITHGMLRKDINLSDYVTDRLSTEAEPGEESLSP